MPYFPTVRFLISPLVFPGCLRSGACVSSIMRVCIERCYGFDDEVGNFIGLRHHGHVTTRQSQRCREFLLSTFRLQTASEVIALPPLIQTRCSEIGSSRKQSPRDSGTTNRGWRRDTRSAWHSACSEQDQARSPGN